MAPTSPPPRAFEAPNGAGTRFAILSIDGGGIRGLIPALVLERLERELRARDPGATLASRFGLIAGTSTGGLIALGLAMPAADGTEPAISPGEMIAIYEGDEARAIFDRPPLEDVPGVGAVSALIDPRYDLDNLRATLERRLGDRVLADALTGLLVPAYDMHRRTPRFFKPWNEEARSLRAVDAGLATAAAPTYFPAHRFGDEALVDGGVFVNNPTVAATIEALKRTGGEPLRPEDLLVVSIGTGQHELGFDSDEVAGWGALGWIAPRERSEPPLIGAMLDGQSDASDHWAHILLNHQPGTEVARGAEMGAGPRYFRWQIELPGPVPLDGTDPVQLARLREAGEALVDGRADEIAAVADALGGADADQG
jgi:predicted acylesterase/phospholipase RssA